MWSRRGVRSKRSGCHLRRKTSSSSTNQAAFPASQVYARQQHVSIIGAMSIGGLIARATVKGGVGSREFRRFVERNLVTVLRPGHIVCMDNLNAHKNKRVHQLIEATGATILYLPPYSPDFNPIEAAWAKLKQLIRKYGAGSVTKLRQAIYRACRHITPEDAIGWFRYCGYANQRQ